jgi:hypothetical protein
MFVLAASLLEILWAFTMKLSQATFQCARVEAVRPAAVVPQ